MKQLRKITDEIQLEKEIAERFQKMFWEDSTGTVRLVSNMAGPENVKRLIFNFLIDNQ